MGGGRWSLRGAAGGVNRPRSTHIIELVPVQCVRHRQVGLYSLDIDARITHTHSTDPIPRAAHVPTPPRPPRASHQSNCRPVRRQRVAAATRPCGHTRRWRSLTSPAAIALYLSPPRPASKSVGRFGKKSGSKAAQTTVYQALLTRLKLAARTLQRPSDRATSERHVTCHQPRVSHARDVNV